MKYTACTGGNVWEGFVYPLDLDTMILAFHFAVARKSHVLAVGKIYRAVQAPGIDKLLEL